MTGQVGERPGSPAVGKCSRRGGGRVKAGGLQPLAGALECATPPEAMRGPCVGGRRVRRAPARGAGSGESGGLALTSVI